MQIPLPLLFLTLTLCWATAGLQTPRLSRPSINRLINKKYIRPQRASSYDTGPVLQYVELPLNHLDSKAGTFMNRYWVDDFYYQPGGPVFFIDNGEDTAEGMEQYLRDGATGSMAETFNGLLILWEHRFYGASMPNLTSDMQFEPTQVAKYLEFLTIEQAMEDVAAFARDFSFPGLPDVDLKPGNTPWVFVGGSYPGARAAWMRLRNPEIFHAALSSSGVVELEEDFWEYYRIIEVVMESQGWSNCSSDMRAVASYVNDAFRTQNSSAVDRFLSAITGPSGTPLYSYFHFDDTVGDNAVWDNRRTNMDAAISVMFQDFQYVGMGGYFGLFCDELQIANQGRNNVAAMQASKGIFEDMGFNTALATYAMVVQNIWDDVLTPSDYPTADGAMQVNYDCNQYQEICQASITQFSWVYQVCSEFGAFQVMNASRPSSLLPTFESVPNWIKDCTSYFGSSMSSGPNLAPINKKYGGWTMQPSNVLFTGGEFDPWRALSLLSIEANSPKRPMTSTIPASGKTPGGTQDTFFGYLVAGGSHCSDLGNVRMNRTLGVGPPETVDSTDADVDVDAEAAHKLFIDALSVWLPAFSKHAVEDKPTITPQDVTGGGTAGGTKKSAATLNRVGAGAWALLVAWGVYLVI